MRLAKKKLEALPRCFNTQKITHQSKEFVKISFFSNTLRYNESGF